MTSIYISFLFKMQWDGENHSLQSIDEATDKYYIKKTLKVGERECLIEFVEKENRGVLMASLRTKYLTLFSDNKQCQDVWKEMLNPYIE